MKALLQKLGIVRPDGTMSVRMRRTLWFTAAVLALIVGCNGVILSRVATNRAAPDAELALSGREFDAQSGLFEDSGRFARLRYQDVYAADETRLAALGYRNLDAPKGPPSPRYPEKRVFVVVELDGPAYARYVARHEAARDRAAAALAEEPVPGEAHNRAWIDLKMAENRLREAREKDSRLFLIDAGLDAATLRRQYPDRTRHAILPGRLRLGISYDKDAQGKTTRRFVPRVNLEPDAVFVPRQFA